LKIDYITITNFMISNLFSSTVVHQRFMPFSNRFEYNVLSMLIDYDEIENLSKNLLFFSYNKFNLFSFNEKDHGYRDGKILKKYINYFLIKNKIKFKNLKIKILCFPRILGYVFNPLSVIYCFDNDELIAIFYEVKNTPNEQHTYIFGSNKGIKKSILKHRCKKFFYVSPFIHMNCSYKFTNTIPKENIAIFIEVVDNLNKKILFASQVGKKIKFNSFSLIKHFLKNPLIIYKVIFLIIYQSIVIVMKGGKYRARKKKITDTTSFEGDF
tara:strand:- start:160 stop:966 length:807 start_codon:yes stop_codon:yes gene_type:complete